LFFFHYFKDTVQILPFILYVVLSNIYLVHFFNNKILIHFLFLKPTTVPGLMFHGSNITQNIFHGSIIRKATHLIRNTCSCIDVIIRWHNQWCSRYWSRKKNIIIIMLFENISTRNYFFYVIKMRLYHNIMCKVREMQNATHSFRS
jgi:hypothetical protein